MRAAILERGETKLNIVNDLEVRDPEPGEVRVRIAFCGLCHSDLGIIAGGGGDEVPIVLGHEAAGTVDAVGVGATELKAGDKVVLTTMPSCGRCYWCAKGKPTVCELNHNVTLSRPLPNGTSGLTQGGREINRGLGVAGFAEMVLTVPRALTKIADDIPLDIASVLGCAVRTGVGAVLNTAQVQEGDSVLVLGLGGVGQSVVMGAKLASAGTIIVSDPVASRREAALALGADVAIDPTTDDVVEATRAATYGRGADFAFDAVGSAALVETGFKSTTYGGATVLVGVSGGPGFTVSAAEMVIGEKKLMGSLIGSSLVHRDVPRFLELWRSGRMDLDALITARRPIEEINEGFDDMHAGVGVRTVVSFA